ncbi:hypothetical protein ACFL52_03100 [Candidatus Margulisiibacteriota bacterium]
MSNKISKTPPPETTIKIRRLSARQAYLVNMVETTIRKVNTREQLVRNINTFINSDLLLPRERLFCALWAFDKDDRAIYISGLERQKRQVISEILGEEKKPAKYGFLFEHATKNPVLFFVGSPAFMRYSPIHGKAKFNKSGSSDLVFLNDINHKDEPASDSEIKTIAVFPIMDSSEVPAPIRRSRGIFCFALSCDYPGDNEKINALMVDFLFFCEVLAKCFRKLFNQERLNQPY